MKLPFERVSSYWVRYDKYVIRTDDKGVRYVTAEEKAKPDIFDPLADPHAIVLDALNVGRLYFMKDYPESQREAALLKFIHNYGLLGLMTALPTTPHFMDYLRVYLPRIILFAKNPWIPLNTYAISIPSKDRRSARLETNTTGISRAIRI